MNRELLECPVGSHARMPRLAILCDFHEEGWPSMDLVADELHAAIHEQTPTIFDSVKLRPIMRRRFAFLSRSGTRQAAHKLDRFAGRFVDYRFYGRSISRQYDMFHVTDHSYGHLVHVLPACRTGVYCHDLDAFRCLVEPDRDPRPIWYRRLATHVLRGLQKASVVFYNSEAVRNEILEHALVPAGSLVHAPLGVAAEYVPGCIEKLIPGPYLLHVGSCAPRKRVDVLLDVFSRVHRDRPDLLLVHVGAPFTDTFERRIDSLGIRSAVVALTGLSRERVAALYGNAKLVLLPSDAEGFCLPVIEALACGARVVASDIPVLREVGGDALTYCPPGNIDTWVETVRGLVDAPSRGPDREIRLAQASRYSWARHARIIVDAYASVLAARDSTSGSFGEAEL